MSPTLPTAQNPAPTPAPTNRPQPSPPVRVTPKIGKNIFSCAGIALLVSVGLLVECVILIAGSGVVRIPLFSNSYAPPEPVRLVRAERVTAEAFQQKIGEKVTAELQAGKPIPYEIAISEQELTGVMQTVIAELKDDRPWVEHLAQVVITPEFIEFTLRLERGIWHVDTRARFVPDIRENRMSLTPTEMRIGEYGLPAKMAYNVLGYVFARDVGSFSFGSKMIFLRNARLENGKIVVYVSVLPAVPTRQP